MRAVIVGAGVIGSAIAWELAKSGAEVTVIDRHGAAGHGSTSASSAIVRFNFSTRDGVALSWEAKHGWERWPEHLGAGDSAARFHRTGLVMLDVDLLPRQRLLPLFTEVGVPYQEWDAATLTARVPGIDPGRYWPPARLDQQRFWEDADTVLGGVYTPDAGYVDDPSAAAGDLMRAASRHGARFVRGQNVTGVLRRKGRVSGVALDGDTVLPADVVVNAAGPWSGRLNMMAEVGTDFTTSVRPLRQEVHRVPAPPGYGAEGAPGPVIADMDLGTYMRGDGAGGLLIGGTEPECDPLQWLDDPDEAGTAPSKALFDVQVARAAKRFPRLGVPDRPQGVVGVYDVTDDWIPIYDRTELDGYYVAIGTSGNQFKNAPVVGALMNRLITEVESGVDHDAHPVALQLPYTGVTLDLGAFSRLRPPNPDGSGTVIG